MYSGLMSQTFAEMSFNLDTYRPGIVEPLNEPKKTNGDFVILVDTNRRAAAFKSLRDEWLRRDADILENVNIDSILKERQKIYSTNKRLRKVVIYNHTDSTIKLQHIDMKLFCTLEFFIQNKWVSQECQWLSWCGNSYFYHSIPSNHGTSFLFELPEKSDIAMRARFKLLGKSAFYYSNEFKYPVNFKNIHRGGQRFNQYNGGYYEGMQYCFDKPYTFVIVE